MLKYSQSKSCRNVNLATYSLYINILNNYGSLHFIKKISCSYIAALLMMQRKFPYILDQSSLKITVCLQDFSISTIAESTEENNFCSPTYIQLCMNPYLRYQRNKSWSKMSTSGTTFCRFCANTSLHFHLSIVLRSFTVKNHIFS